MLGIPEWTIGKHEIESINGIHIKVSHEIGDGPTSVRIKLFHMGCNQLIEEGELIKIADEKFLISKEPTLAPSKPTEQIKLVCPDVVAESLEVVLKIEIFSILIAPNDELCTLTLKTTTSTTETLAPLVS